VNAPDRKVNGAVICGDCGVGFVRCRYCGEQNNTSSDALLHCVEEVRALRKRQRRKLYKQYGIVDTDTSSNPKAPRIALTVIPFRKTEGGAGAFTAFTTIAIVAP
jgi:hypothetical protein